ncbi:MAG TPA: glycine oxidase ThiO [Pyrinomonadaceae bacterium]|nr:glycine oxidase ThiO [Pyrinomonadaceae bacterium]
MQEIGREILIVGAGVIGLSIARELSRRGIKRITIIDRGPAGHEATFAAGGMLAVQAETDEAGDFFELCSASRDRYPQFAAELGDETGIDIGLDQAGTLYLAFTSNDSREIDHRYHWQKNAGLNVERLSASETRKLEPFVSPDVREGLIFPDDWQVENRKLAAALLKFVALNGIELIEGTECRRLIVKNGRVIAAETSSGKVFAQQTIIAAGAWTSMIEADPVRVPEIRPIRGQIVGFQTAKRFFSHVIYSPRGYLIPRADGRILAGATVEDVGFENLMTPAGIEYVRRNAFEIAPSISGLKIAEEISGLRPKAADALPVIGGFPHVENLIVASGHYRNGILLAPITADAVADIVVGNRVSSLIRSFGVDRTSLSG